MNTVRLNAYAKLNLTLDVTGTEGGYHTVDSLVTTVDLFDRIVAKKRKDGAIRLFMHGMGSEAIPPEENHAQAAAERYVVAFGTTGADITVYKNIPIGAGLGGSSADAAGALLAMNGLYGAAKNLKPLADECGSDTGYLLRGGFARMRGRGEDIEPLGVPPELCSSFRRTGSPRRSATAKATATKRARRERSARLRFCAAAIPNGRRSSFRTICTPRRVRSNRT